MKSPPEWHILYENRPLTRGIWLTVGVIVIIFSIWTLNGYTPLSMQVAKLLLISAGVIWSWVPRLRKTGIASFYPVSRNLFDWVLRYTGAAFLVVGLLAPRIAGEYNGVQTRFWITGGGLLVFAGGIIAQNSRRPSPKYDFSANAPSETTASDIESQTESGTINNSTPKANVSRKKRRVR